jgi:homoserine dehydrogenase
MTQEGELATYTSQVVGNLTKDGRVLSVGVNFWSTQSTDELAFMNDMMNIFKFQADQAGNISAVGWEWKY